MDLQQYIQEVETLLGRIVSPVECRILNDLFKDFEEKETLYWIEYSKFKDRPINYARTLILKKCKKKEEYNSSEWLEKLKQTL